MLRCFLVNAAELGTYDHAKHELQQRGIFSSFPMLQHVTASGIAGLASASVSTPADVVKTRLMDSAGKERVERGVIGTFNAILRQEGPLALYKGFSAILVRKVVWCSIFFVTYEQVLALDVAWA